MTHVYHHQTKFRWTENLTCRFIQLRKENGKLFTGRKYSAQAGWEFILRQMREEFPTIMADVHYRVLKKKWSNLLQQYKELKNPVHGDRNKADDVSWPFYNAIDQVLGHGQRSNDDEEEEDIVDPHEFLCVSVTLEEGNHPDAGSETDDESCKDAVQSGLMTALQQRTRTINEDRNRSGSNNTIVPLSIADLRKRASKMETKKRNVDDDPTLRLPRATQLSIEPSSRSTSISVKDLSKLRTNIDRNEPARNGHLSTSCVDVDDADDVVRPVKKARRTRTRPTDHHKEHQCVLESRLTEFLEYAKQRDEENRSIMTSILQAVEKIANKF